MVSKHPNQVASAVAAIGLRAHSGWAALVVVAGSPGSPSILERRHIVLADAAMAGSKQPYHAAEGLPFPSAEQLIGRCLESSRLLARQALGQAIEDLAQRGYKVAASGLLLAAGRPLPALSAVLASHALIHSAEGEMFRDVLAQASESLGLHLVKVKERQLLERAAAEFAAEDLPGRLAAIGKNIGPPWRQDEKYAALAAWLALASWGRTQQMLCNTN